MTFLIESILATVPEQHLHLHPRHLAQYQRAVARAEELGLPIVHGSASMTGRTLSWTVITASGVTITVYRPR